MALDYEISPQHIRGCSPDARLHAMREVVTVQACGVALPLVSISGACLGTAVQLATASLPFGAVVVGSQARRPPLACAP